jgi:hypothetical protein
VVCRLEKLEHFRHGPMKKLTPEDAEKLKELESRGVHAYYIVLPQQGGNDETRPTHF